MRNSPHFILYTIFLMVGMVSAQTRELSFQIMDGASKTPLVNTEISISPCGCGGISDDRGRFSIELPEADYRITITYLGFGTEVREVQLNKDTFLEIELFEKQEALSEVILRAKRNNDILTLPQMGVVRVSSRELKMIPSAAGEVDLLRAMVLLPGVNNAGELSNGLSVRGGSLDQNLVLLDDAPIFNPTHLFGLFSIFTPDVIASSDLYRANIPSRYGGRATSVLDVKVKNPYVDKLRLSGGIGLVSSRLNIETPIIKDKLMLLAGGRAGVTDFLLPIFSERLKNTKARFYDGTIKVLYLPTDKDQVTLTGFLSKDFYQLDLVTPIQNINAESNQYDFRTLNGTLNWAHSFNENANLKTVFVAGNYTPKIIFPERASDNEVNYESNIEYFSFLTEYSKRPSTTLDYYIGGQANRYGISPGDLDPGTAGNVLPVSLDKETSYEFAGYGTINWSPNEHVSLSGGLRFNHYVLVGPYTVNTFDDSSGELLEVVDYENGDRVKAYNALEPRLGFNLKLGDRTSLKGSYARLNQYLQNIYNSTSPVPTSRWKTSDPFVRPQVSDSYGLGIYKNIKDTRMELGLEAYYRDVANVLTYKPGANFFLGETINRDLVQGQGKAYGAEFSFKKPEGKVNGWFNYAWSRSRLRSDISRPGDRINNNAWYPSDFDRTHVLNTTINFESDPYNTWSFNFTAQTGRPYTAANGIVEIEGIETPLFLERNNARLPTYHRLDFSWNVVGTKREGKRWKGDWTFTIYNVYGRKNPYSIYYNQRTGTENADIFLNSPLGSYELSILNSPLLSLTYSFVFQ